MKTICINHRMFNKVLGYGSWCVITVSLIAFALISDIENNASYELDNPKSWAFDQICYFSIIYQEEQCDDKFYDFTISDRNWLLQVGMYVNFIIIIGWTYFKQQIFRFSWCEK